jgi:hypothetical protein
VSAWYRRRLELRFDAAAGRAADLDLLRECQTPRTLLPDTDHQFLLSSRPEPSA